MSVGDCLNVLAVFLPPLEKLLKFIRSHRIKKELRRDLIQGIGADIEKMGDYLDRLVKTVRDKLVPLLRSMVVPPKREEVAELCLYTTDIVRAYTGAIESFYNFVRSCKYVCGLEQFMESLKEHEPVLYDFVKTIGSSMEDEEFVKLNRRVYVFFKVYENRLFGTIEKEEVKKEFEEHLEELKPLFAKARLVSRFRFRRALKRGIRKELEKAVRKFYEVNEKIKIEEDIISNFRDIVPSRFREVALLLDELLYPQSPNE